MSIYIIIEAVVGIIAGLLIAICTKKDKNVSYCKLDIAGCVTNIFLLIVYIVASPMYLFLGLISNPAYDGFLGIIGWILSLISASASMFCALGLGVSVALRKKGKSKLSFAAQFAGAASILLTLLIFFIFYGNLLRSLN